MPDKCPQCGSVLLGSECRVCALDVRNTAIQQELPRETEACDRAVRSGKTDSKAPGEIDIRKPEWRNQKPTRVDVVGILACIGMAVLWVILVGIGGPPKKSIVVAASLLGGPLCLLGAILNWDIFFAEPTASNVVETLGRNRARVFYAFLGLFLTVLGAWLVATLKSDARDLF